MAKPQTLASLQNAAQQVAANVATATGNGPAATDVADRYVDPAVIMTLLGRIPQGTLVWSRAISGGAQFCVSLPNGTTLNVYANAPGTAQAKSNLIPPDQRVPKAKTPKVIGSLI